jgi:hypothetical protein
MRRSSDPFNRAYPLRGVSIRRQNLPQILGDAAAFKLRIAYHFCGLEHQRQSGDASLTNS